MSGLYGVDLRQGVPLMGPVTALAAAGAANAAAVFQLSNLASQVGTKTFYLTRIIGLNAALINTLLHIGTGVAAGFVAVIPAYLTMNGLNFDYTLPEPIEITADLTAYPVVATVTVQVEVIEVG